MGELEIIVDGEVQLESLGDIEKAIATETVTVETALETVEAQKLRALQSAWRIGKLLEEGKRLSPHGGYEAWLDRIGYSKTTAADYRKLAKLEEAALVEHGTKAEAYKALGMIQKPDSPAEKRTPPPPPQFGWVNKLFEYTRSQDTFDDGTRAHLVQLRDHLNSLAL